MTPTTHHYDELVAQQLLNDGKIEELIVYCIPTAHAYLKAHKWAFFTYDNYADVSQELLISIITSINSYRPEKCVKLLSWLYTNYRFTCLAIGKKENPFMNNTLQLDDEDPFYYLMNDEVDSKKP